MLYFGCIDDIPDIANSVDEIWLIVRQLKPYNSYPNVLIKHIPDLAPSLETFLWARGLINNNNFTNAIFTNEYTSKYINDLKNNKAAMELINYLLTIKNSTDKKIWLGCYCKTDLRCHRRILKNIIINGGIK